MYYCSHTDFLTDLSSSSNPIWEKHEINCPKTDRNGFKKGRVYTELYMTISAREKFSDPSQVLLFETFYVKLP